MRRLLPVLLVVPVLLVGALFRPGGAGAETPTKYGWWSATNSGALTTPAPPQVPPGGIYVAGRMSDPSAIAALTYAVPPGSTVNPLLLHVASTPVMTAPPVACVSSATYEPAENGPWAKRPLYDCRAGSVTGKSDTVRKAISFDVAGLLRGDVISVVILAGGTADSLAFDRPGADSLVFAPAPAAAAGPPSPSVSGTSAGGPALPALPGPELAAPAVGAPAVAATSPKAAPPNRSLPIRRAGGSGSGVPGRWAKSLALAALLGFLGAYALGYGILGGRIGRVGLAVDDD